MLSVINRVVEMCYWKWDIKSGRLSLSPPGTVLFGHDVSTVDDMIALAHPDDASALTTALRKLRSGTGAARRIDVEFRMQSVRGEWQWFALKSGSDGVHRLSGVLWNVDRHRKIEENLTASENRLKTILNGAPGCIAITDASGRVVERNRAFRDIFGDGEVSITSLLDTAGGGKVAMDEAVARCLRRDDSGAPRVVNGRFTRPAAGVSDPGRTVVLNYGVSAIVDYDGNVSSFIFAGTDVTAQRQRAVKMALLTRRQTWLFDVLGQFNRAPDIESLFAMLRADMPNVISFSSITLAVPSFAGQSWLLRADDLGAANPSESTDLSGGQEVRDIAAGKGLLGEVYTSGASRVSSSGASSVLAVPVAHGGVSWGVMALHRENWDRDDHFDEHDVALMNIVGDNIAVYLDESAARTAVNVRARRLQSLHDLVHSLLQTRSRSDLIGGVIEYLRTAVPDSACAIYALEGDRKQKKTLRRVAEYGNAPDDGRAEAALKSGTPFVGTSGGAETRRVTPLIFQDDRVGVIDLHKPSGLSPGEAELYRLLSDYVAALWVLYDIVALREMEAFIDPLTGIWNRRYMFQRLYEENDRIARYGGNACLVVGDMGNFKDVNDRFGHAKGDEVLIRSAEIMKSGIRISDSVGRYGGDEFIILLPNISEENAKMVMNRIERLIGDMRIPSRDDDPNSEPIKVFLDFGMAVFPGAAATLMDSISMADENMYANKLERKKRMGIPRDRR
jgi:diguanylate cyclase (GGDEF)-like protein/PAS domain S-box-containing protein